MKGLSVGALGALLLGTAAAAGAQDGNTIGNPALRDFQLHPRQQQQQQQQTQPQAPLVTPPPPAAVRPQPAPPAAQPPAQQQQQQAPQPQAQQPRPAPAAPRTQAPVQTPQARPATPPPIQAQPQSPAPAPEAAPPAATETPAPAAPAPLPPAATPAPSEGGIPWLYLLPAAALALALAGLALLQRRRRRQAEAEAWTDETEAPAMVSAPPAAPRAAPAAVPVAAPAPDPALRPWLELSVKVERAQTTLTETVVNFELEIANTGKIAARNLRIDVKMFNAGAEQDKEIGAFFRTAGRESTKLNLPGIPAETTGVINASVTMAREDMRAVVLEEKYLFVPVIAVNALYDWGEGRSGQTSKSYVVGRELQQPGDKMGAFRVDQGPRVWRTIGQRKHSLERRV